MRVLLAQINPIIGDLSGNTEKILHAIQNAGQQKADMVVFPELALSGYPAEDFLLLPHFIEDVERHLEKIIQATRDITVIVGLPRNNPQMNEKKLFNSAAVIHNQKLLGFQDKVLLPTYDVFDERRYFEPGNDIKLFEIGDAKIGVTICEDIWQHSEMVKYTSYRRDPVKEQALLVPDFVVNLSSSPYSVNKTTRRLDVCCNAAKTLQCPLLLCNQVGGNDSLIFDGYSLCIGKDGRVLDYAKGFKEDFLLVDLGHMEEARPFQFDPTEDLYSALVLGVHDYFHKLGFQKACLGISGGIDSALVACIAKDALGAENVLGIMMPSRYTSENSNVEALQLIKALGIKHKEIPIEGPFTGYLDLLKPNFEGKPQDVTEENLQARIRGMILMAISNKLGHIVLSTGNKSELAMGFSTLYGDMCGGLGVISDITKRQVYELSKWINRDKEIIPYNTIQKPPSAELRPNQKDSDTLPDYDIVDNVLQAYVEEHNSPKAIASQFGYPLALVEDLIKRIHRNEYKRRQSPPGLRISEKAFSVGRHFPIVQRYVQ